MCSRSGGATHTRARARTHTPFCPQSPRRGVLPGPKPAACASSAWRWGHKGRARHCRPPRAPRATRSRKEAYFTRQPPTRRAEANAGSASSREGSAVMVLGVGTLAKVVTRFARGKGVPSRSQRDEMAVPDVACETEMQGVDKRDEVRRGSQRVYRAGIYLPGGTEVRRLYPRGGGAHAEGRPGPLSRGAQGGAGGCYCALCAQSGPRWVCVLGGGCWRRRCAAASAPAASATFLCSRVRFRHARRCRWTHWRLGGLQQIQHAPWRALRVQWEPLCRLGLRAHTATYEKVAT